MSEPAAKPRQTINLDEFERRLGRPTTPANSSEDPLAELARLVGDTEDRYKTVFQGRPATPAPPPFGPRYNPAPAEPRYKPASTEPRYTPAHAESRHPAPGDPPYGAADWRAPRVGGATGALPRGSRLGGDFAAIEAGLRGSFSPDFHAAPAADPYSEAEDWLDMPYVTPAQAQIEPLRSRLPLYATAAIIILGMAGIGGSFVLKRNSIAPHEIAMIKAADGPTKIQASDTADVAKPNQDASILDKSPQPTPVAVVNRSEEPVDLGEAQQASASQMQVALAAPNSAAVVPVPTPPALDTPAQPFGLAGMIEPKKVKTVVVRPDGTIVSNDAPQQGLPAISPVVAPPPALDDAAPADKNSASKSTARVVTTPGSTAAAGDTGSASADASVDHLRPSAGKSNMRSAQATSVKVADADIDMTDAPQPTAGKPGSFAVQLAAPPSEAEARQTMAKLQKKFADELGTHRLKYRAASVADKSVYRVRVVGLSHEEAAALCQKLQAKGGNCFVAKN